MNLTLQRESPTAVSTPGKLYVEDILECYTLERAVGEGKGPIPAGTYEVIIDFSNRFQRMMPHLTAVPNFSGIRIHSGNTWKDTEGCILLGVDRHEDWVGRSREAFNHFFPKLEAASLGSVFIKILEP